MQLQHFVAPNLEFLVKFVVICFSNFVHFDIFTLLNHVLLLLSETISFFSRLVSFFVFSLRLSYVVQHVSSSLTQDALN